MPVRTGFALILFAASFALAGPSAAQNAPLRCSDVENCELRVDHVSSQASDPFRHGLGPIGEDHPRWDIWGGPIAKYRSVRDCLPPEAGAADPPRVLAFDWSAPDSLHAMNVCLFRIVASLKDYDEVRNWFAAYGFRVSKVGHVWADTDDPYFKDRPLWIMSASMPAGKFYALRPNWLHATFGVSTAYSASISVQWDGSGRLVVTDFVMNVV
ncbi:hypothetical protein [Defluviimonas salinarum]|uniref:Uncharacterized protein n=1 Tax=Defluviimonas salinarum TaxID=2992147 RepID=A0ABT3J869_9RHOB|nr:hypothetical protein [Defluviimonas salinarum]MCW3783893.1 hypothetical protein [Defluviimonas salinarum]